ncbi:hypothetical protein ElyMa_004093200 [Elysia marginata]|uniref:Peptidase S1 domain-containing protein n=1 Tax=Elysia marginata TaxID=1093978 RepID=A0AAV4GAN0_9GAST|nr:hypothetical protein ElyMa_004093200 [Elysia marginata]
MPKLRSDERRTFFRSLIDRTVRLRVQCTSSDRSDEDEFAEDRGTSRVRMGTGFVQRAVEKEFPKSCSCDNCQGKVPSRQWIFHVVTASHLVYNTEEAKETMVDLFFDDDSCQKNKRMESVWASEAIEIDHNMDWCVMEYLTCKEDLGERVESAYKSWVGVEELSPQDLSDLGLLPSSGKDRVPVLIVSHPHGRSKKVTIGEMRDEERSHRIQYNAPTCPGSSGAPVTLFDIDGKFAIIKDRGKFPCRWLFSPVHSGTFTDHPLRKLGGCETMQEQINYGYTFQ